ncbi:hypothetical protein [Tumebacillus lipolyticus]|uniref:Uncharacterized protein n=1 Tax=Tumebacillus lipolyticus TaxID=1280370 RepID=A0ABW5A1L5_9BACL
MKKANVLASVLGMAIALTSSEMAFAENSAILKDGNENSIVQPLGGDYVTNSLTTNQPYFNQLYLDGTGNWDGGNGFFGSTIYWGDGSSSGYSGYNKSNTWRWLYATFGTYNVQLKTSSGGLTSWDSSNVYVKNW